MNLVRDLVEFRCAGVGGRYFYGEVESDNYEGFQLVVKYGVDYENDKSVYKGDKDEVNVKVHNIVDWGVKYGVSVKVGEN